MKNRKRQGFALVVTLTLMVILTVVAVGMLGLSTISLRSSSQGESMATARANARMAMMLALGELQKELGPDQRISAPGAQQLEDTNTSGPKQWTGVYDSWKGESWPFARSEEIRPATPTFRRWLISGDDSLVTKQETPKTGLTSGDKISLVAATKAQGSTPAQDKVEAGLIKFNKGGTIKGGSAWWIGDQNTKAKIGGVVEDAADAKEAAARLQSAPRAGHEVFGIIENQADVNRDMLADDQRLDKLSSTNSLQLLPNKYITNVLPPRDLDFFHDATATSLGLMTNVRAGGLRKDLNFLLETPKPQPNSTKVAALYTAGSTSGINLGELWVDHNVWAELEYPSSPPKHADGGTIPSGMPFLKCAESNKDTFLLYKHIPRLQLTLLYSLISRSQTVGGQKKYDLFLVADPVFTIWNPFDVYLEVPQDYFATIKSWAAPYDLNLNLDSKPFSRSLKKLSNDRLYFFYGLLGRSQKLVMRPGEVQVIAQGFDESIKDVQKGTWQFEGKLGWQFASGYAYPIPYETDPKLMTGAQKITYSMTPNAERDNAGMFLWSYNIGELLDQPGSGTNYIGSFNIDLVYSRLPGEQKNPASAFPKIFPELPLDSSAAKTIAELENNKWPICVFTYGLRTELDPLFDQSYKGKRFTGRAMLRANETSLSQDLYNLDADIVRTSPLQVSIRRVNSLSSPIIECDANGLGYYGAEYGAAGGTSYVVTRSVPREPIHSLGALQHAAAEGAKFGQTRGERSWFMQPSISHAISNSFAPSFLLPSEVRGTLAKRDAADHSYLANLALWDTYFYSSIKPKTQAAWKNPAKAYEEQRDRFGKFLGIDPRNNEPIDPPEPLPNERMRPWTSNPEATLKAIFPGSTPDPNAADRIASYLMIDGMFNVNSTSVTAWKAFLSGLKKAKVPSNPTPNVNSQPDLVDADGTAVAALLEAAGEQIDDGSLSDTTDPEQWRGFRSLNDKQVNHLAKAIVKQVRKRGPFLSIADFVNRRPGLDEDLAVSGALQSALDDVSIEDKLKDEAINEDYDYITGDRALKAPEDTFPFPRAELGAKAIGSPGYVKQGDLLTTLGPMINVRGDTFVIRAYGEAREGNGASSKVTARAWCEVTVQRVPDYVDPKDESYVPTKDLVSDINKTFGRRFNVVSFRYLDPSEVL